MPAARIIDCLPQLWLRRVHHGADSLARGEELAAVGVLLAHLREQVSIYLGEGEEVDVIHVVNADLTYLVQHVAKVRLIVHPRLFNPSLDAAKMVTSGEVPTAGTTA